MLLYHYYDKKTGPFKNLSDLSDEEANKVLRTIKSEKPETMCAKRQDSYVDFEIDPLNQAGDVFALF